VILANTTLLATAKRVFHAPMDTLVLMAFPKSSVKQVVFVLMEKHNHVHSENLALKRQSMMKEQHVANVQLDVSVLCQVRHFALSNALAESMVSN
jgi:hypothetical protein